MDSPEIIFPKQNCLEPILTWRVRIVDMYPETWQPDMLPLWWTDEKTKLSR